MGGDDNFSMLFLVFMGFYIFILYFIFVGIYVLRFIDIGLELVFVVCGILGKVFDFFEFSCFFLKSKDKNLFIF